MVKGGFCKTTCGKCNCNKSGEASNIPPGCNCTDTLPPDSKFSCANQVGTLFDDHITRSDQPSNAQAWLYRTEEIQTQI